MKKQKTKSRGVPSDAVRRQNNHLAEGEHTGHFHDAIGPGVAVYDLPGPTALLLDAPGGVEVIHQEHGPVAVTAGLYHVTRVLEYDHFAEEARAVED